MKRDLRYREFRLKHITIGIESIQERIDPALVAHVCQPRPITQRCDQTFLLNTALSQFRMRDQRVGYFREGGFNRLLVLRESRLLLRLSKTNAGFDASGRENRLRDLRHEAPCSVRAVEEFRQLRALTTKRSTETDLRKISGLRRSDNGVRCDQIFFGSADVRPPFEQ